MHDVVMHDAGVLPAHFGDPFGEQRALIIDPQAKAGHWALTALRIGDGTLGPNDLAGSGEVLVFLHLDGSDNVLPQAGDLIYLGLLATGPLGSIGRITSSANHYELGPIALAAVQTRYATTAPLVIITNDAGQDHQISANPTPLPSSTKPE